MPRTKSEVTREKDAARMKEKYTHLGYTARKEEADAFKKWCAAHDTNPTTEIRNHVRSLIKQNEGTE